MKIPSGGTGDRLIAGSSWNPEILTSAGISISEAQKAGEILTLQQF
ncbi:hypothetical protein [Roseofilum capinflatum]|uniref:Uncharacterized protein n=1 Tax=Roseofilum capinflatum BLCC-M114 TaxID=3022440 RepID=A0ABT7B5I9_9CYAN|nr:hypothetical protein [Roseofilum capinflatum]MDJ1174432.1 hypothetical protein [Roseofilum capinflatum BLCC-M114]